MTDEVYRDSGGPKGPNNPREMSSNCEQYAQPHKYIPTGKPLEYQCAICGFKIRMPL